MHKRRPVRARADRPNARWPHSTRIDADEVAGQKPYGFAKQAVRFMNNSTTQYQISRDNSGRPVIAFPNAALLRDYEVARNRVERNMHHRIIVEPVEVRQKEQIRYAAQPTGSSLIAPDDLTGFLIGENHFEENPPW